MQLVQLRRGSVPAADPLEQPGQLLHAVRLNGIRPPFHGLRPGRRFYPHRTADAVNPAPLGDAVHGIFGRVRRDCLIRTRHFRDILPGLLKRPVLPRAFGNALHGRAALPIRRAQRILEGTHQLGGRFSLRAKAPQFGPLGDAQLFQRLQKL